MKKRHILLIYTGGTIGMIKNPQTGALDTFNFQHLKKHVPELNEFDYDIQSCQFEPPLDSSDIKLDHWAQIVHVIDDNYTSFDGFVILHGTDTMAYTASALSFMLENLSKPVVLTGSQLPIGVLRTDGRENIVNAIEFAAAADDNGDPIVQEVAVCFGEKLFRGNRVTKCNADNFNAFTSYNCNPLAVTGVDINYDFKNLIRNDEKKTFMPHFTMDPSVIAITLFPGLSQHIVEHVFGYSDIKGIVLRTFGSGNAPRQQWLLDAIKKANDKGKVVVNITQCQKGTVEMGRYETGFQLHQAGVVSGRDMTVECAVTKLMYLFAQKITPEEIRHIMSVPIAGELTP